MTGGSAGDVAHVPTLILGAGRTGLSAAFHVRDPARYRLIEREKEVGGLAKTRTRPGGFLCDGTGHWLHLRTDYAKEVLKSLFRVWKRPVGVETVVDGKPTLLRYDGTEHSQKSLKKD